MWLVLFGSTLFQLMEKLRPKTGNPLEFNIWFLFIYLLLFIPDVSDNIKSHFFGGGIPTLNMLMIFMEGYSSCWYIYTKYVSNLKTEKRAIFELWCKVQVCHATLCLLICLFYRHWPLYTRVHRHRGTHRTKQRISNGDHSIVLYTN